MKTFHALRTLAAAALMIGSASGAYAIDGDAGDYTPLPAGANLGIAYLAFGNSDTFDQDGVGEIPNSKLNTTAAVLRFVHFSELGGKPIAVQAFAPFVNFRDIEIGGTALPTKAGMGDLTVAATYWPIAAAPTDLHGTTLGLTLFATLPTGNYEFGRASAGSGTYTITPQVGYQQGLGGGFFFDAYYDVAFASDHTESGFEVSVDPAQQLQTYLRYEFKPGFNAAIGYSAKRGGEQYVDGIYTGTKSESEQLRISGSAFLNATTQIQGGVSYDTGASGGFKSGPNIQIRLLKVF